MLIRLGFAGLAMLVVSSMAACSAPDAPVENAAGQPQSLEKQPIVLRTADNRRLTFEVEVADEFTEQRTGMMFRTEMGDDDGMIFLYSQPRILSIWMKNTLISLDILFIDSLGRIINIRPDAIPGSLESMRSERAALAVIELKGGRAAELGIKPGDIVLHCHFGNWPCPQ